MRRQRDRQATKLLKKAVEDSKNHKMEIMGLKARVVALEAMNHVLSYEYMRTRVLNRGGPEQGER